MKIIFIGVKNKLYLVFKGLINKGIRLIDEKEFEMNIKDPGEAIIIMNFQFNISSQVIQWLWNRLRLNEERIGKKLAGLPVLVLGMNGSFLETPEGKVFRDFPKHHKYLTKPLNLYNFLQALSSLSPVDQSSLCVINEDAPPSLLEALEHDLKNISKKFNFSGGDEEVKKRFQEVELNFKNYEYLQKNKKKVAKIKKEINLLKNKIIKRRGNLWI